MPSCGRDLISEHDPHGDEFRRGHKEWVALVNDSDEFYFHVDLDKRSGCASCGADSDASERDSV